MADVEKGKNANHTYSMLEPETFSLQCISFKEVPSEFLENQQENTRQTISGGRVSDKSVNKRIRFFVIVCQFIAVFSV